MQRNIFIVLLIAWGLMAPAYAKKQPPPLGGSCTEILSPDDMTPVEYTGQPQTQAVFGFVDQGKTEGEVTLRGEFQCPSSRAKAASLSPQGSGTPLQPLAGKGQAALSVEPAMALCTDLILKRSDGRHVRVAVNFDDISEFDKYEAVHLRPAQDSLFFVAHPVTDSPALDSRHWLAVLNVETCEWTGMLLDFHTHSIQWPTIVQTLRLDDPRFKPEADYLETAKFKDGYFSREMIAKDRANPEKSKYVWLSDNSEFVGGKTQGSLKLQWYPGAEKDCATEKNDLVHGHSRFKDTAHIRVCNDDTKQWAWLFVADGYEEDTSTTPARIDGAQLTVETKARRVVINLDTLAYMQIAKVEQQSPDASSPSSAVSLPVPPTLEVVPAGSVVVSSSTPVEKPVSVSTMTAAPVQPPTSELDEVVMSGNAGGLGDMQLVQMEDDAVLDKLLSWSAVPSSSRTPVALSTEGIHEVQVSSVSAVALSTGPVLGILPLPILKVEDNPVLDQLLSAMPASSSATVQTASSASSAFAVPVSTISAAATVNVSTSTMDVTVSSTSVPVDEDGYTPVDIRPTWK